MKNSPSPFIVSLFKTSNLHRLLRSSFLSVKISLFLIKISLKSHSSSFSFLFLCYIFSISLFLPWIRLWTRSQERSKEEEKLSSCFFMFAASDPTRFPRTAESPIEFSVNRLSLSKSLRVNWMSDVKGCSTQWYISFLIRPIQPIGPSWVLKHWIKPSYVAIYCTLSSIDIYNTSSCDNIPTRSIYRQEQLFARH